MGRVVIEFFRKLLINDFMPHKMCYLEDAGVLWLNAISDSLIALAYYMIPFLLLYLVRKRRDTSFNGIWAAFAVFILACGTTHLLGTITVWNPVYRLEGVVKAVTAVASLVTFVMVARVMPVVVRIPTPAQLEEEIETRRAAEAEVRTMNMELEARVASRTAELVQSEAMYRRVAEEQQKFAGDLRVEMGRRKELEGQLIQAQKMEAVGRLAGGVAHDFNNLLTVILGYNEMLRDMVKSDESALDFVQEMQRAAERASALTNQLLAFSRRQLSVPRVLDLNELVRRVDKMLRRIIGEDIELTIWLAEGLGRVKADPSHIDQVILNLAVNSRDAMPHGGKLTIETANVELTEEYAESHLGVTPGPYVMLAVSDTGTGMDAVTRAHLFEPFFTTKEKGKGTGLGLSIVYGIVKQNGGEIMVYSEPGQGAVFKIYLPVVQEEVESSEAEGPDATPGARAATILLVEDEDQVRNLTRAMLARQGHRILDTGSATEALELAVQSGEAIDMVLTDIVMPRMNGVELAAALKERLPQIKVLFMSGYTDEAVVRHGILAVGAPFLQKPFTASALRAKINEVLG